MPGVNEQTILTISSEDTSVNKLYITAEETQKPEEVKVEGKLPTYLAGGKYLRVGPSKFDFKDFTMTHWLDGYALLSKFEISKDSSSIIFEKKYVESDAYKRALVAQKPQINEFNTRAQPDGKKGFFARVIASLLPEFTDNSYSTLFQLGSDLFATCDTQYFHKLNSNQLSVECKCDASKSFGVNGQCAHPVTDANGDVYNIGFTVGAMGIKYHLFKIPYAKSSEEMLKKTQIIASVSPRWTGQMGTTHSFGKSENYFVLVEQPCTVSTKRIAASFVKGDTLKDWLEWNPLEKNRFIIIEKNTGKVFKTEFLTTTAFYYLHFINCYEESNQIVVDIVVYDSPNIIDTMIIKNLRENKKLEFSPDMPYIQRFVVPIVPDLKASNVEQNVNLVTKVGSNCSAIRNGNKILITGEKLSTHGMDLPTINKRYFSKKANYVYASGVFLDNHELSNTICKVDLETKKMWTWTDSRFTYPGEPYFFPDPKGTEEDDGVLLVGVTDKRQGHNDFLVILDAKNNLKELARASFKNHLPTGLHGIFLPN